MSATSGRKDGRRKFRRLSGFEELAAQLPAGDAATLDSPAGDAPTDDDPARGMPPGDAPAEESAALEPTPKRKSRLRLLLGLAGLGVVFVWLIPVIVAQNPLLNWVVAAATGDLKGKVTIESASLGWFSPPAVSGVEVRDQEGQPVLAVDRAGADRSLLSLLWNWTDLGRIRVEKPELSLVLRDDGSNLEDVLAGLLSKERSRKQATRVGVHLEIVDGTLSITHPRSQKSWQIGQLQLVLDMPADVGKPVDVKTSGVLADPHSPGRFAAGLKMELAGATPSDSAGEAALQVENLPLEMFAPLVARFATDVSLKTSGRLTSAIQGRFALGEGTAAAGKGTVPFSLRENRDSPQVVSRVVLKTLSVEGTAAVDDLAVSGAALGTDRLALKRVESDCRLGYQDGRLQIDRLAARTDVGAASLAGTVELAADKVDDFAAWLPRQAFDVQAQIDLARLAGLLPGTLRIRADTEIVSGQLELSASSRPEPDRVVWRGRLAASNLTAVSGGRRLNWQQPILATLAAYQNAQGPFVENLNCESDFLKLDASGTPDKMTAQSTFDLNRLAAQLGQLVDLGGLRLAGGGWARLAWSRAADHRFEARGDLQLKDFQFAAGDRRPWVEPKLTAAFSASGVTDFASENRLDAAAAEVTAGEDPPDQIRARLTQPVLDFRRGGAWPVEIRSQGRLAQWLPRIGPWVDLDAWQLAGTYDLTVQATGSADAVTARQIRLVLAELEVHGDKVNISEPKAELAATGAWDQSARRVTLSSASLTAGSLSAGATDVVAAFPPEGSIELAGAIQCQGDLTELSGWVIDPAAPPPWRLEGRMQGHAQFQQSAHEIAGTLQAAVSDLAITHSGGNRFQEKEVRLTGRGAYNIASRELRLEEAALSAAAVSLAAAGRLAGSGEPPQIEVDGKVDYDLEQLSRLAQSYLGDGIYLTGRGTSPLSLRGPTPLAGLQASTKLGWAGGQVYGFQLGPGELQAALADGVAQVRPAEFDVSEGRLHVAAQVRLAPQPPELTVPPGPLVENVRISPQMCAHGLQFIAPVLAGVATAEGRFTIELDGCRIPLSDPATSELAGRMIIHSAEIGPGPLVRELALALGYTSPARLAKQSTIDFRMVEGRVYHRGVVVEFPDLTVRTYGWVGLDRSLGLMAEMPVPPKWLGSNRVVNSALKNQTIRLPIGGTLDRPQVDRQELANLSRQFLRSAATNVIQDRLIEGLDRLLKPPR